MLAKARKISRLTGTMLAMAVLGVLVATAARADPEPFDIENAQWKSYDHYNDDSTHAAGTKPLTASEAQAPLSSMTIVPPPAAKSDAPTIAAPTRPIDLPILPGMNKGFGLNVKSTEEDNLAPPSIPDNPVEADPPPTSWKDPLTAMSERNKGDDDKNTPLAVRQSYLPSAKLAPSPSPDHASAQKLANSIVEQRQYGKKQPEPKPEASKEDIAALKAYKQQQLNAIQSDRETLKALQDAISSLGLQKQLNFMAPHDSVLNLRDQKTLSGDQTNAATPQTTVR